MDSITIKKIINNDRILKNYFIGVFARDELPIITKYPSCFILNTHESYKKGEHWLAFFIDETRFCIFFDSYGHKPSHFRLESYLNNNFRNWSYNDFQIQGFSEYCGYYCILFLLYSSRDKLKNFFNEFNNKCFINDYKLNYLIKNFE